jgi:hypothetical protein
VILHLVSTSHSDGLDDATDDTYLHVTADGKTDVVHRRRVGGQYAGLETVTTQPHGVGDLDGAVDRKRDSAGGPIRTFRGYGFGVPGFAAVVAAVQDSGDGTLDVSKAKTVTYEGRDAYEVDVHDEQAPMLPNDKGVAVPAVITLWIARDDYMPLAVRYMAGDSTFLTERVSTFERLPDDPEHRALLDFAAAP